MRELRDADYSNTRFNFEIKQNPQGQLFNADLSKVVKKVSLKGQEEFKKIKCFSNIYRLDPKNKKELKELEKIGKMLNDNDLNLAINLRDPKTALILKEVYNKYSELL